MRFQDFRVIFCFIVTRTFLFHSVFVVYLGYKTIASFLLGECSSSRFCLFSLLSGNRAAFHYNCHSSYITSIGNVQECLCRGEWTVQFVWCIGVKVVWMACFIAFKWIKYLNISCVFIATNRSYFSMNCWKFFYVNGLIFYISRSIFHINRLILNINRVIQLIFGFPFLYYSGKRIKGHG